MLLEKVEEEFARETGVIKEFRDYVEENLLQYFPSDV